MSMGPSSMGVATGDAVRGAVGARVGLVGRGVAVGRYVVGRLVLEELELLCRRVGLLVGFFVGD